MDKTSYGIDAVIALPNQEWDIKPNHFVIKDPVFKEISIEPILLSGVF